MTLANEVHFIKKALYAEELIERQVRKFKELKKQLNQERIN